jgi:hypothetical protein
MINVFAFVIAAAIIAALSIDVILHQTAAQTTNETCMDADTRDKARALMFEGINDALTRHTSQLFDNLMKDRGHDPARMTRGMHTSLALYARSRENLLKWSPPACKE